RRGALGADGLRHHEAGTGEAGTEHQHDEDRQVLTHAQTAPAVAARCCWASLSRRWRLLARTTNTRPDDAVKAMPGWRSAPRSRCRTAVYTGASGSTTGVGGA